METYIYPDITPAQKKRINGFDQRVARKQLCKHGHHATIEEAVFSEDPTDAPID
jgi:hypothetical protein